MGQATDHRTDHRNASLQPAAQRAGAEARFKPLGLPALAAAVRVARPAQTRPPRLQDLPAILREDALIG